MLLELLLGAILFPLIVSGPGWWWVARLDANGPTRLLAAVVASLITAWLIAWVTYVTDLPIRALWVVPVFAASGWWLRRREAANILRDPLVRSLLFAQGAVTLACLAWLGLVGSYSGGGWSGDWLEHWERSRFFIQHWPHETRFIGMYTLPARPPLANVLVGLWLALTRVDFALFQFFSTALASLAFLPLAVLAWRWGGRRSVFVAAALVMMNPLFVQNATFPWTKLPAAFFVLAAVAFTLVPDRSVAKHDWQLTALALSAGLLTHYSTGPYIIAFLAATVLAQGGRWSSGPHRPFGPGAWLPSALLLGLWFGWSLLVFGFRGTFLSNTTVTDVAAGVGEQAVRIVLNLRDTIVPVLFRSPDLRLIAQDNPWGALRDWLFQHYQLNLLFAFGLTGWLVLGHELVRIARHSTPSRRWFWSTTLTAITFVGVAVHGARDTWGLVHICLQPLVLLGLGFLAARWTMLTPAWRLVLALGASLDFAGGVVLHFLVQLHAAPAATADISTLGNVSGFSITALINAMALVQQRLVTFHVAVGLAPAVWLFLALAALGGMIHRARTTSD